MCDDCFIEENEGPVWDRRALDDLCHEFQADSEKLGALLEAEEREPAFDPIAVRNLLREEKAWGREPDLLILGRVEMASFRHFVSRGFGEESGSPFGAFYFLGIPVVADASATRLEFVIDEGSSSGGPSGRSAA